MPCKRALPQNAAKNAVSGVFDFPQFTGIPGILLVIDRLVIDVPASNDDKNDGWCRVVGVRCDLRSFFPQLLESRPRGETMISFKRQAGLCAALALTAGTWLAFSKADDATPAEVMMPVADFPKDYKGTPFTDSKYK